MNTFSIVLIVDDAGPKALEIECDSPTVAIGEVRTFLAELVERLPEGTAEVSAAVGPGGFVDDGADWFGAWEWSDRNGWCWSPRGVRLA